MGAHLLLLHLHEFLLDTTLHRSHSIHHF